MKRKLSESFVHMGTLLLWYRFIKFAPSTGPTESLWEVREEWEMGQMKMTREGWAKINMDLISHDGNERKCGRSAHMSLLHSLIS